MTAQSGVAAALSVGAVFSLALRLSPQERRSAQKVAAGAAKRAQCAAVGGKRASAREDPVRRVFIIATPPIVECSEKLSVCQGRAAFGGCFANLDSQPFFTWASCVGLR